MEFDQNKMENILNSATYEQKTLIERTIDLWGRTVALNGRPQHFDSFDTDKAEIFQEWYFLLEEINNIDFGSNIADPPNTRENLFIEKTSRDNGIYNTEPQVTPKQRFDILKRDGFRCQLCGATAKHRARLEVDHKTPVSQGGTNDPSNLWTLCFNCNRGKRDSIIDF